VLELSHGLEVERARQGDKEAFTSLVRQHQMGVYLLCLRFTKNPATAEDVTQESFLKAYQKLSTFKGEASFKAWLYRIAINNCRNRYNAKKEELDISQLDISTPAFSETKLLDASRALIIQRAIDQLPHRQKTSLILRIYEDLSFAEIAQIMECPYDTAKANYRHAILKLADELEEFRDFGDSKNDEVNFGDVRSIQNNIEAHREAEL
jgi:RNA polymerase sigma-70 factor, ECF subfamily